MFFSSLPQSSPGASTVTINSLTVEFKTAIEVEMTVKADLTKRGKNVLLASAAAVGLIIVWSFAAFAPEDSHPTFFKSWSHTAMMT
jgi:hypothetical protein